MATFRCLALRLSCSLAAAVAVAVAGRQAAAETFAELARRLPDDANAAVVVNAQAIYESPLGQREKLREKYADRFEAAPLILPPSAERCVLASELDLDSLQPAWQAAVMELSIDPSPADIARQRRGRNDVLAGSEVTWLGSDLCILKFAPRLFGVITPVNRQQAARWADDVKAGTSGELSPYLKQSIEYADSAGTSVILAVDLAHTFDAATIERSAAGSEALEGVALGEAAKLLASIQGVKLGVKVTDKLTGKLQFDFSNDVTPLAKVAKPLLLKIMAKAGAMLPEFSNWTPAATTNSLSLQGELTPDGMRRIFSLLAVDASSLESAPLETATNVAESADAAKASMGQASLRYFRGVNAYIEDLQRLNNASSLDQAVMWIENYARRVDALPSRNVDPELVQYGKYVAQTFRSVVDQASGALAQADAAQQPVVTNYKIGFLPTARTVNWGGNFQRMYAPYGNANVDVQATEANIRKSQEAIDAAVNQAKQTLVQLVSDNQTVRSKLSAKYGLKF